MPFLSDIEQIMVQSLNKFCYNSAVSRVQTNITIPIPRYFTNCTDANFSRTILTYETKTEKVGRTQISDGSEFDFKNFFTVQVKYDIYGFRNFYAEVCFIGLNGSNLTIREKTGPSIGRSCPSLVNYSDKFIFVIGGVNSEDY